MSNISDVKPDSTTRSAWAEKLKKASDAALSDEARLRLYEKFNQERASRGESLLEIPAELLARVKAKAAATPKAAKKAAVSSKESAALAAEGGAHFARATGRGGKRFGGKMKQGTVNATRNIANVAKEMGRTVTETGRIITLESYQVLREAPQSKGKALLAPPRLAGKGMKAGMKMVSGAAKTAAKMVKGGAVMTKDAASVTATGMIESARMGKAFAESSEQIRQAGDTLTSGIKDAAREVLDE